MFRDKHEVFRDKQHYQYMTKLTVYTSNITINKYSFEAPNRDKHDSHEDEAAPPGTKVQTTQASSLIVSQSQCYLQFQASERQRARISVSSSRYCSSKVVTDSYP